MLMLQLQLMDSFVFPSSPMATSFQQPWNAACAGTLVWTIIEVGAQTNGQGTAAVAGGTTGTAWYPTTPKLLAGATQQGALLPQGIWRRLSPACTVHIPVTGHEVEHGAGGGVG